MKLVIVESPFSADTEEGTDANIRYGCRAMDDAISRGEAPFASHLLYTLVLNDEDPDARRLGITLGQAWMAEADLVAVYCDRGISPGMQEGIRHAQGLRIPVEHRWLGPRA